MAPDGVADPYGLISRHSHWLCNSCPGIPATAGEAMPPFLAKSRVRSFCSCPGIATAPEWVVTHRLGIATAPEWVVTHPLDGRYGFWYSARVFLEHQVR